MGDHFTMEESATHHCKRFFDGLILNVYLYQGKGNSLGMLIALVPYNYINTSLNTFLREWRPNNETSLRKSHDM